MRLINSQIIYPVELMRAKEFGFEPLTSHWVVERWGDHPL
jgi:hypothetical protein